MTDDRSHVCGHEIRNGDVDVDLTDDWVLGERFGMETDPATGEALWRCYRRTNGDDDRCLFHMNPDERRERGVDDETLSEVLVAVINDTIDEVLGDDTDGGLLADETPPGCRPLEIVTDDGGAPEESPDMLKKRRLQFIGATFGDLNLSYEHLAPPSSYNINLFGADADRVNMRHARVSNNLGFGRWGRLGQLDLSSATIDGLLTLGGVTIDGNITLSNAEMEAVRLDKGTIAGDFDSFNLRVFRNLQLNEAAADGDVTLQGATIGGGLYAKDMMIDGDFSVRFADADEMSFKRSQVDGQFRGNYLQTERGLFLNNATVRSVSLDQTDVGTAVFASLLEVTGVNEVGKTESVDEEEAAGSFSFQKSRTAKFSADGLEVAGDCDLSDAEIQTILSLDDSSVGGTVNIDSVTADTISLHRAEVGSTVKLESVTANIVGLYQAEVGGGVVADTADVDRGLIFTGLRAEGKVSIRWASLRGLTLKGAEVGSLDGFRGEVTEATVFRDLSVDGNLRIKDATLGAELDGESLTVGGHFSLSGSDVDGPISLKRAVVENGIYFDDADVSGDINLTEGSFVDGDLSLVETEIDGGVSVRATVFSGTVVVEDANLNTLVFDDGTRFGRLAMCDAQVEGSLRIGDCRSLPLTAGGVYVTNSEFWRVVVDSGADGRPVLGGPLVLQDSVVRDQLSVSVDPFRHPGVRAVSLAGSRIPDARLVLDDPAVSADERIGWTRTRGVAPAYRTEGSELVYDLSDATIGQLETVDEGSSELPSYYQFRFWMTEFKRFRFGEHRADFANTDWAIHELRPWGDQDVAAVTEPGRGRRSKPDTATDLAGVLSPAFVEGHEQAIEGLASGLAEETDPSQSALGLIEGTRLTFPTPSAGDVGESTTRTWETAVDIDPAVYDDERAVLERPDTDHTGAAVMALQRVRSRLVPAITDAYTDRGLASTDGGLSFSQVVLDRIAVEAVRGCLDAVGSDSDDENGQLVADHVREQLDDDDPVTSSVDHVLDVLWRSPLYGSPLADVFHEDPEGHQILPEDAVDDLNGRLDGSGVEIADFEAFEQALSEASDRASSEPGTEEIDPADVPLRALHLDAVAEAVSETEVALRQVVWMLDVETSPKGDTNAPPNPFRAALGALIEDIEHDFTEESLASMLAGWEFDPEARVRIDVWNAATSRAYQTAAEAFGNRSDLRSHRLQQLEGTYTLAKKAAADVGENAAASKLHYRQREYARALHDHHSRRWTGIKANFLRLLTGYGEKPQWVVYTAGAVIGVWTGLFALTQATTDALPEAGPLELLSLSVGSFATLLPPSPVSGPEGHGIVVRLLTEIEALLGVFLVAVFVFTLTKSLQR